MNGYKDRLQHPNRINIHLPRGGDVDTFQREGRVGAAQEQMPAVGIINLAEEAWRRADHLRAGEVEQRNAVIDERSGTFSFSAGADFLRVLEHDARQSPEWGITEFTAVSDFLLIKARIILRRRRFDHVMVGLVRLQNRTPT